METTKNFPDNGSKIFLHQRISEITHDTKKISAGHQRRTKKEIRAYHKNLRDAMTEQEAEEKSRRICEKIVSMEEYKKADVLYAYYPSGKEADCLPIIKDALLSEKLVALPRVWSAGDMDFFRITSLTQVQEGTFHVMEPRRDCPVLTEENAFVLVPGVVFDRNGNRYGYGRGYYDRYFARFPHLHRSALAYENQLEDHLETLDTDMKMDDIITEKSVYDCLVFDDNSFYT